MIVFQVFAPLGHPHGKPALLCDFSGPGCVSRSNFDAIAPENVPFCQRFSLAPVPSVVSGWVDFSFCHLSRVVAHATEFAYNHPTLYRSLLF
jgi:hypothetical protein